MQQLVSRTGFLRIVVPRGHARANPDKTASIRCRGHLRSGLKVRTLIALEPVLASDRKSIQRGQMPSHPALHLLKRLSYCGFGLSEAALICFGLTIGRQRNRDASEQRQTTDERTPTDQTRFHGNSSSSTREIHPC